jgi:hypothetical protein
MGSFDHLLTAEPAPATGGGSFDHILTPAPADEPKSIGRAAQDLPQDMQMRADYLKKLIETKGEPGYGTRLADNFTMGLARPIGGAVAAIGGEGTAGERYRAAVGAEEDYVKRAERNTNPYLGAATDVIGGIASGGPGKQLVSGAATVAKKAPSRLAQIGRAMMGATGSGVIEGAAHNAESVPNALIGGGVGGVVGGVTGGLFGAATSRAPGVRGAAKEVAGAVREGGSEGLKTEGGKLYQKLDQAGIKFADTETPKLLQGTVQTMADKGFNKEVHKELIPALEQIGALKGKPATWTQLQNIRTQISDAKASDDKRVRRMAGHLGDVLDNFVETARPTLPPRSVGINVGADSKEARDLWRRGSQAETAEFLSGKGMLTARDPTNKLRTNFGAEVDRVNNPKRFSSFQNNPEQVGLMEKIAKGDPKLRASTNFLDQRANNLLTFGLLGAAGGGGAHYFGDTSGAGGVVGAGGLTSLALGAGGKVGAHQLSKIIANRGASRVDDLVRNIVTGSTDRNVVNTPRDALAKVLAAEQLKRGAGRYSSSFFNKE